MYKFFPCFRQRGKLAKADCHRSRAAECCCFAHVGDANLPARYVCGYLPDIGVPVNGAAPPVR